MIIASIIYFGAFALLVKELILRFQKKKMLKKEEAEEKLENNSKEKAE